MWPPKRHLRKTQSRQVETTGGTNRTNFGPSVPRREVPGHECAGSPQQTRERWKSFRSTTEQFVVDITLRSALTSCGAPRTNAATQRSCVDTSPPRQGSQVHRTRRRRKMPSGRGGIGDTRSVEHGGSRIRGGHGFLYTARCTSTSAPLSVSRVEEKVDENVGSVVCQVVRHLLGHGSARCLGRRRWVGT